MPTRELKEARMANLLFLLFGKEKKGFDQLNKLDEYHSSNHIRG